MSFLLILIDLALLNIGFFVSFWLRFGFPFPPDDFLVFKSVSMFLTLIFMSNLFLFKAYRNRFMSSWDLFAKIFLGLFCGTLLSMAFFYTFRFKWGTFPTSLFPISFAVNLIMIFKVNQFVLRAKQRIKMRVVILGKGKVDEVIAKTSNMEIKRVDQIQKLLEYPYIDEVIVSEEITDAKDLSLLLYMKQKLEIDILFTPSVYMNLLPERINGNSSIKLLNTFVGRRSDLDEYLIRMLDIVVILVISFIICPAMLVISFLIKMTSSGSIFYKQQRVGKDGEFFVLYKFRTMVSDAEKKMGFAPASKNDSRVTGIGKWLRRTRLDELPQLLNVIKGEMSLVGPRPENLYRVGEHKALQGLRLAVKPGLTGLAQVRSCYDLHPKHKVKYDYLYIQRRSFWLNINIMLKTIPAVFSKKGW